MFISPNIKIQTETKKLKSSNDKQKKSLIDSGIELLLKKTKHFKDGQAHSHIGLHADGNVQHNPPHHHQQQQHHHHHHHHSLLHKKEHSITDQLHHHDTVLDTHHKEERKWNPFENIKIHTEKRKHGGDSSILINKKQKGES